MLKPSGKKDTNPGKNFAQLHQRLTHGTEYTELQPGE
jgi:hypothetical protein